MSKKRKYFHCNNASQKEVDGVLSYWRRSDGLQKKVQFIIAILA